jgi:hypothetical protein
MCEIIKHPYTSANCRLSERPVDAGAERNKWPASGRVPIVAPLKKERLRDLSFDAGSLPIEERIMRCFGNGVELSAALSRSAAATHVAHLCRHSGRSAGSAENQKPRKRMAANLAAMRTPSPLHLNYTAPASIVKKKLFIYAHIF